MRGGCLDYSGFAPENFTTLPHFSISAAMNLPKSAGAVGNTVEPRSAYRALTLASERAALIVRLSASMISGGVFRGALSPNQMLDS